MRYERVQDVVRLAVRLQGSRGGLTLDDIQADFSVSRRTAERLRDAVEAVFGPLESVARDDNRRHWRLRSDALRRLVSVSAEELGQIASAAAALERAGFGEHAKVLLDLTTKLRATLRTESLERLESDLEALVLAEGLAMRPGPRSHVDPHFLALLREAILTCRMVEFRYFAQSTARRSRQRVRPNGLLYGNRVFLVAMTDWSDEPRLWRLANAITKSLGWCLSQVPSFLDCVGGALGTPDLSKRDTIVKLQEYQPGRGITDLEIHAPGYAVWIMVDPVLQPGNGAETCAKQPPRNREQVGRRWGCQRVLPPDALHEPPGLDIEQEFVVLGDRPGVHGVQAVAEARCIRRPEPAPERRATHSAGTNPESPRLPRLLELFGRKATQRRGRQPRDWNPSQVHSGSGLRSGCDASVTPPSVVHRANCVDVADPLSDGSFSIPAAIRDDVSGLLRTDHDRTRSGGVNRPSSPNRGTRIAGGEHRLLLESARAFVVVRTSPAGQVGASARTRTSHRCVVRARASFPYSPSSTAVASISSRASSSTRPETTTSVIAGKWRPMTAR